MRQFTDATGKQWQIDVTVSTIERVRDACAIRLDKLFDDQLSLLESVLDDPLKLADILWALIDDGGDKAAFLMSLAGDSLESAGNALVEATIDFFPNPKRRHLLRETIRKAWAAVNETADRATAKLAEIDPTSFTPATNSPESLESIPHT